MTGYSGTPLLTKLGIDGDTRLIVNGAPPGWVASVLRPPSSVRVGDMRVRLADVVLLFCSNRTRLESGIGDAMSRLPDNGAIWVAWPKRASGVVTDLTENVIREVVLPKGLVDVKVAALDETWSGLKLVIRRELRGARPDRLALESGIGPISSRYLMEPTTYQGALRKSGLQSRG